MLPAPPPSPSSTWHSSSSSMSLDVSIIAILGIIATAVFLLIYYVFVLKCCLHSRRPSNPRPFSATGYHPSSSPTSGLDSASISAIPTFLFTPSSTSPSFECSVCLADILAGERLRLLPTCSHAFHIDCLDTWLQSCASCPICRSAVSTIPPPRSEQSVVVVMEMAKEEEQKKQKNRKKKLAHAASMGDERVEEGDNEEWGEVQGLRRSLSLDSSCDRHVFLSVQKLLRRIPNQELEEGSGDGDGEGNGRRGKVLLPYFSYGNGRSSRSSVLPVEDTMSFELFENV